MISVIIPIYNVEKYLPRCLDSISAQTFTDVEFLLIDDGSKDKSGEIADRYSDSRFHVFHTENNGLSAARNFGIEKARGEWIMFVDGDDWVDADFCRIPYEVALSQKADLVIFRSCLVKRKKVRIEKRRDRPCGVVSFETAIEFDGILAWNKLYKKVLFNNIKYPIGKTFEDLFTTHKVIFNAHRIIFIPDVLYFQVYRKESITHDSSLKNRKDAFAAALEYSKNMKVFGCSEQKGVDIENWHAISLLVTAYPSDDSAYKKAEEVVNKIPGIPRLLPWKHKMALLFWKLSPRLFHIACRFLGQKDKTTKKAGLLTSK